MSGSRKFGAYAMAGLTGAALMYMGPEAVADFFSRLRDTAAPAVTEGVGLGGDVFETVRTETGRHVNVNVSPTRTTEPGSGPVAGFDNGSEVGN